MNTGIFEGVELAFNIKYANGLPGHRNQQAFTWWDIRGAGYIVLSHIVLYRLTALANRPAPILLLAAYNLNNSAALP